MTRNLIRGQSLNGDRILARNTLVAVAHAAHIDFTDAKTGGNPFAHAHALQARKAFHVFGKGHLGEYTLCIHTVNTKCMHNSILTLKDTIGIMQ